MQSTQSIIETGAMLLSFMRFPSLDNDQQRVEACKVIYANRVLEIKKQSRKEQHSGNEGFKEIIENIPLVLGESKCLVEGYFLKARSDKDLINDMNRERELKAINTVSQIIWLLLQQTHYPITKFNGVVSLQKAIFVLCQLQDTDLKFKAFKEDLNKLRVLAQNVLLSKGLIEQAWKKYKSVAPLIFAYSILPYENKSLVRSIDILKILAYAHYAQDFLLKLEPSCHSPKEILAKDEMWVLPDGSNPLKDIISLEIPNYLPLIRKILGKYNYKK